MRERLISYEQLALLTQWLETEPRSARRQMVKKFPGMTVCGERELIKTFCGPARLQRAKIKLIWLTPGMSAASGRQSPRGVEPSCPPF